MSQYQWPENVTRAELLDDEMLELADVTRICCVTQQWLLERIEQQVVQPIVRHDRYYFTSATVVRIRQVIHVEQVYDADPQLAALVADLTEEVQALRLQVKRLSQD